MTENILGKSPEYVELSCITDSGRLLIVQMESMFMADLVCNVSLDSILKSCILNKSCSLMDEYCWSLSWVSRDLCMFMSNLNPSLRFLPDTLDVLEACDGLGGETPELSTTSTDQTSLLLLQEVAPQRKLPSSVGLRKT